MSLYRRKDSKVWWISIKTNCKRIRISTNTQNKRLAEQIHAKVFTEIQEGRWFESAKAKKVKFSELVDKYMSRYQRKRDIYSVKRILPIFDGYTLSEITSEMISDYMYERLQTVKPATVYQELSLMRHMFNVARKEWKWTKDNPVEDLSFSVGNKNARERWLTIKEETHLLENATNPKWLKPLLIVALHTGMRRGEILNLHVKDVDLRRKLVTVLKSKNKEKRSIPMSQTLYKVLKDFCRVVDISGRVFHISVRSLRCAFERTIQKAEIEDFHFQDLRHTFATRLVQNGVDLYKVKELLGHKSIVMTMRYAHHYPESLRSSVEILDQCSAVSRFGHVLR